MIGVHSMLKYWTDYLSLNDWNIELEEVDPEAVTYDSDVPEGKRYYIGVWYNTEEKHAVIYHDRPLDDESMVHELLHVAYPDMTEEGINRLTEFILIINNKENNEQIF